MRRLIYAPKVYVFVRSANMKGTVYDVSADVTSGEVTQNLSDLSTARWTLRNRYRKWIRDPDSGQQIFLPMDMVTIWLQRIAGRPIQVFTGYLNEVPYYQAYPGDAIFSASCTLKKLAFTWFDPGLPFFQAWVMSNDGWFITPDGNATNPTYLIPDQSIGNNAPLKTNRTTATTSDGGFDELLGRFLVEVAGWANEDVLISDLPKDLPKLAAKLYADVNKNSIADLQALEQALGQVMGVSGWQNNDPNTPTTSDNSPAQDPQTMKVIRSVKSSCDDASVPILACALAGYVQTALDPAFDNSSSVSEGKAGYGLYGMLANGHTPQISPQDRGEPTIDGTRISDIIGDALVATQILCKRMNKFPTLKKAAQKNSLDSVKALAEAALGQKLPSNIDLQQAFSKVKQYCSTSYTSAGNHTPASQVDPGQLTFADPKVQALLSDREKQVVRDHYGNTKHWLAGIIWRAKQVSPSIVISVPQSKLDNSTVSLTGPAAALSQFMGTLVGDDQIDKVDIILNGSEFVLAKGKISSTSVATKNDNTMLVNQTSQPTNTTSSSTSKNQGTAGLGQTINQLVAVSTNASFAAQFAFPANYLQSINLTGNRALMNDVSCLDGVKQFCQASMRSFRSLPDGRFLAFYPDYFGASRKPYWQIYNIEITNFGIQLNDEALATHVYVTGDTFAGDGQVDWQDQVSTRGVATVTQAFMLNSFIEPWTYTDPKAPLQQPEIGRLHDAFAFLEHYGARPYEEQQPLIRNVFYEFLIAWQRFMQKWSSLFATECTFTFQPEVMAGGLIAFPDHGVQMFCESVTHSFDYTGGFSTSATLTAPSLLPGKQKDRLSMPGFALGGNVNTVGT